MKLIKDIAVIIFFGLFATGGLVVMRIKRELHDRKFQERHK